MPQQDHGAGGEQPGHRRRHQARRQQDHHGGQHGQRLLGARAHRDGLAADQLGRIDDQHVGVWPAARRAPARSPAAAACRPPPARSRCGPRSSPLRCTARMTRSPLGVTMPGNTASPINAGARRDHDLGEAGSAVEQGVGDIGGRSSVAQRQALVGRQARRRLRVAAHDEEIALGQRRPLAAGRRRRRPACATRLEARIVARARRRPRARRDRVSPSGPGAGTRRRRVVYCSISVRACLLRSAGMPRPLRLGSTRGPTSRMIAMVPEQQRHADPGILEEAERRAGRRSRRRPRPAR